MIYHSIVSPEKHWPVPVSPEKNLMRAIRWDIYPQNKENDISFRVNNTSSKPTPLSDHFWAIIADSNVF